MCSESMNKHIQNIREGLPEMSEKQIKGLLQGFIVNNFSGAYEDIISEMKAELEKRKCA